MYEVKPLEIGKLDKAAIQSLQALVEERLWPSLQGLDPWNVDSATIQGIAAYKDKQPIGIILATLRPHIQHARLLWLYLKPLYRRIGIEERLINALNTILEQLNCLQVSYLYRSSLPTTPALEAILHQLNWSPPRPLLVRCHFHVPEFSPAWFCHPYCFPKGYKLFPWHTLQEKDKQILRYQFDQDRFSSSVSPFHDEATIESINSLGLRKGNEIIGWMITNRISKDLIQYSSLYIDRTYYFLGYAIYMLIASIQLQKKSGVEKAMLEINLDEVDSNWVRFVKKRLVPNCTHVERYSQSYYLIRPDGMSSDEEMPILES